jgi:hypothetical protein
MHGLEGVKVLELGDLVSAAYATKLMADLGADVMKVEELGGNQARRRGPFPHGSYDPEQSGLFLALNTNKRGCTYDLTQDQATLRRLVVWAPDTMNLDPRRGTSRVGTGKAGTGSCRHSQHSLSLRLLVCFYGGAACPRAGQACRMAGTKPV